MSIFAIFASIFSLYVTRIKKEKVMQVLAQKKIIVQFGYAKKV